MIYKGNVAELNKIRKIDWILTLVPFVFIVTLTVFLFINPASIQDFINNSLLMLIPNNPFYFFCR